MTPISRTTRFTRSIAHDELLQYVTQFGGIVQCCVHRLYMSRTALHHPQNKQNEKKPAHEAKAWWLKQGPQGLEHHGQEQALILIG